MIACRKRKTGEKPGEARRASHARTSGSTGMAGRTGQAAGLNRRSGRVLPPVHGESEDSRAGGMESGEPFAGMTVISVNGMTLCVIVVNPEESL